MPPFGIRSARLELLLCTGGLRSSVLMAFIPTRFNAELSHVGACMTATLSSSHTSSLVIADARIGWPVAPSDFACRDFPPCRQPAVRFLTL